MITLLLLTAVLNLAEAAIRLWIAMWDAYRVRLCAI